jgi:hypothetical protein
MLLFMHTFLFSVSILLLLNFSLKVVNEASSLDEHDLRRWPASSSQCHHSLFSHADGPHPWGKECSR